MITDLVVNRSLVQPMVLHLTQPSVRKPVGFGRDWILTWSTGEV
jgi:hypothetical protein